MPSTGQKIDGSDLVLKLLQVVKELTPQTCSPERGIDSVKALVFFPEWMQSFLPHSDLPEEINSHFVPT